MRITGSGAAGVNAPGSVSGNGPAEAPQAVAPASPAKLQSLTLQPAMEAMRALPEIDHARIDALREALARGEVPFDADKLAGLIERFHGSKG
ncbi:flagellar biosynthesis anti-sigma factor FlgM [Methyloversatilis sp.]|uniref:flagellar biosynthesis anti-sigma factor FlgM n=1 Tax=Methyloversatilis sp. TaxID=2569862 RepID=UPI003D282160